jgi:hypothetical protein
MSITLFTENWFSKKFLLIRNCRFFFVIGNSTCFQQVDQGHVCNDTKLNKNQTTNPLMKFFYDQQLKKCSSFLYHGCGGNENRFDEENQCIEKCLIDIPTNEPGKKKEKSVLYQRNIQLENIGCGSNMIRCNIQCRFGFERDSNGCEICRCFEPCQVNQDKENFSISLIISATTMSHGL